MQVLSTHVPLKYTSAEYKYEQIIAIPKKEVCLISYSTIEELFDTNIREGFPHVLAFVHDDAKGQDVYDANSLGQYLAKKERWKWLNPATQKTIRKIDYFVIHQLEDGYRLVKEVNVGQIRTAETYESFWFCNNLAAASDLANPHAFHSMKAMSLHYRISMDYEKEKEVKYNCFRSIEKHYGRGIALLLIPAIRNVDSTFLEKLLFQSFNYDFADEFFLNSPLDSLIKERGIEFFNPKKDEENDALYQNRLKATLDRDPNHQSYKFLQFLSSILRAGSFNIRELHPFLNDPNKNIASLATACIYAFGETQEGYIQNLRKNNPNWSLGEAYELSSDILRGNRENKELNFQVEKLCTLSETSQDPLLLKLIATIFERFQVYNSPVWSSSANICMKMICISRFNINAVDMFAKAIEDSEFDNSLSLLYANFKLTESYSSLLRLSDQEMAIGIRNKDKALYEKGVSKGVRVFNNREKHNLLTFSIGKMLIAEITPYRSSKELELIGVEALKYTLEATSSSPHIVAKLNLAEYFIRRGTTLEAQEAYKWLIEIKAKYPNDPLMLCYFIRHDLRFAKNEADMNDVETRLAEIEKTNHKLPLLYLLKALWYSHPLKRNHPEWFILASQNLIKAFKDADQSGVDFLIKNLGRFDKLTDDDQARCRVEILDLLGNI